eukprot:m.238641 g.238641  ORF g.238641 m.238641 type:complete len:58 (+) comp19393_c0_seq2:500-673(+)
MCLCNYAALDVRVCERGLGTMESSGLDPAEDADEDEDTEWVRGIWDSFAGSWRVFGD